MFWARSLPAALLLLLGAGAAHAQVGCVPNPNLTGPPFVNGCPLPASALNNLAPYGAVSPEAYKQASDPDDTNSIIAALATCKSVTFSSGKTYTISKPLPLCSGGLQEVSGHGPSSVVKLAASYDVTQHTPCSAASDSATWRAIFYNPNCGGPVVHTGPDKYIEFDNFKLDASASSGAAGATIGIFLRNVQFANVHDIVCDSFADCTAFLASTDTVVRDSVAVNNYNAGFDHWDSPNNAIVINTTVYCNTTTATAPFGLLFNASDTTSTHDGQAVNYRAIGNSQYGCVVGVLIDPLTNGGTVQNISVIGNLVDALAFGSKNGINIGGTVNGGQIVSPVFRDFSSTTGGIMYVGPSTDIPGETGNPTGINISNPTFINVTVAAGGVAPLRLLGSTTNRATGVDMSAGTNSYPYAVDVDTTGTLIEGRLVAGTSGLANVHGSYPQINNLNYTSTPTLGACGTGAAIGGISAKGTVYVGTAAITSCTVNFPSGVWAYAPTCGVNALTAGHGDVAPSAVSTSALTITATASISGISIQWVCTQ